MRIVWLKSEPLHPIDKGGKIRTYHTLAHLKTRHHVTYLTLDDGTAAPDAPSLAREYCHDFVAVPIRPPRRGSWGFYLDLAKNLLSPLPYVIARYRAPAMHEALSELLRTASVDLIVCDFLTPSLNLPDQLPVPAILFQHNVEATIWARHAAVAWNPLKRAYMREQWRRMQRYERSQCLRFDHVVAVSEQDRDCFAREYGARSVSWVPTGVDTGFFRPSGNRAVKANEIVFVGSMDWMPNQDGVMWFASEVLPLVRRAVPGASFTVVGRHPSPAMKAFAEANGIELTGTVPDIRPYLERAAVVVVPLRVGGGTRLKIYEAMAMEKAVVSTTIGAEGLSLRDGVEIRLADEPAPFAAIVCRLVADPGQASRLGKDAANVVRSAFSWERAAEQFARSCEEAAARVERTGRVPGPTKKAPAARPVTLKP